MTKIYGDNLDLFEGVELIKEEKTRLKKYDQIEAEIQKNYVNNHKCLMDCYTNYKISIDCKVNVTEEEFRKVCSSDFSSQNISMNRASNLTYYVKIVIEKEFEQLFNFQEKIPFSIKAILKIILLKARGIENLNIKIIPK